MTETSMTETPMTETPMTETLFTPLQPDRSTLDRLHARLADEARVAGMLDLAYTTVDSPVGPLLLVSTEVGIVRVAFEREGHETVLSSLADSVSPRILRSPARLSEAASQLDRYFSGELHRFDLPLDLRLVGGFRLEVIRHLVEIGYGRTESYTEVAMATGRPQAVRAVGTACGRNPLPVVVPCHRVVRSDGSFGGYLGGTEAKHALLALERRAA
jgi:methylated-DNA-[protein]-cysteine S-methyltransferase